MTDARMDSRYDIYGLPAAPLADLAAQVQALLGLRLGPRESGYYAGTYYLYKHAFGRELKLYENHNRARCSWVTVRSQYREHAAILEVSDLEDMDGIRRRLTEGLPGVVLLSSRALPAQDPGDAGDASAPP